MTRENLDPLDYEISAKSGKFRSQKRTNKIKDKANGASLSSSWGWEYSVLATYWHGKYIPQFEHSAVIRETHYMTLFVSLFYVSFPSNV